MQYFAGNDEQMDERVTARQSQRVFVVYAISRNGTDTIHVQHVEKRWETLHYANCKQWAGGHQYHIDSYDTLAEMMDGILHDFGGDWYVLARPHIHKFMELEGVTPPQEYQPKQNITA